MELIFDIGGANEFSKPSGQRDAAEDDKHEHPRFDTYTYETEEPLSAHTLHGLLQRLPKTIFRAKGLVNLLEKPDYPCVLQSTGRRATLTVGRHADLTSHQVVTDVKRREMWLKVPVPDYFADWTHIDLKTHWAD